MKRIAGVVVLFNPQADVVENIKTYLHQIEALYVIDNSPETSQKILENLSELDKIVYITRGRNIGVAMALNIAARRALEVGFEYLLTMDQDSAATRGMLETLLSVASHDDAIGMISPFHLDRSVPREPPPMDVEPVLTSMTSGSIVSLKVYQKVGEFMERLFVDYIDIEYCLRLHIRGYKVVRANRAILFHAHGQLTTRRFLFWTVYPRNYSPMRYYYQTRNRFYLRRLYGAEFAEYFHHDRRTYWRGVIKSLLYEKQRIRKILMILRGFIALWQNDFPTKAIQ